MRQGRSGRGQTPWRQEWRSGPWRCNARVSLQQMMLRNNCAVINLRWTMCSRNVDDTVPKAFPLTKCSESRAGHRRGCLPELHSSRPDQDRATLPLLQLVCLNDVLSIRRARCADAVTWFMNKLPTSSRGNDDTMPAGQRVSTPRERRAGDTLPGALLTSCFAISSSDGCHKTVSSSAQAQG
jgi:hypothetical protein